MASISKQFSRGSRDALMEVPGVYRKRNWYGKKKTRFSLSRGVGQVATRRIVDRALNPLIDLAIDGVIAGAVGFGALVVEQFSGGRAKLRIKRQRERDEAEADLREAMK